MRRKQREFNARRYMHSSEIRFIAVFFILLYLLGGALIWLFYGRNAMFLGWLCMTGGLFFVLLVYGIVSLMGWWAGE